MNLSSFDLLASSLTPHLPMNTHLSYTACPISFSQPKNLPQKNLLTKYFIKYIVQQIFAVRRGFEPLDIEIKQGWGISPKMKLDPMIS
jgi:hypothetical protein